MYNSEASRWQALLRRDQAASSSFVYAVISTKIYCRPGCPSRLARRANICFYDTAQDAAKAGYRPCLRCKPEQASFHLDTQQAQRDIVRKACNCIEEHNGKIKFPKVAKEVGLSTRYLYGLFKTVMGTTPAKFAENLKSGPGAQESSVTPSAASEAISPVDDFLSEPVFDTVSWNALLNLDYADLASMPENSTYSLQYNDITSASQLPTTDYSKHQQVDTTLLNFDNFDQPLDFYQY